MEPDTLRGLLEPETRTIIRFYFWAAGPGKRNRTIIRSGQRLNQAGQEPEKRTMAVFCGFGMVARARITRHTARARLPEAPPQVFSANLWVLRYYVLSYLGRYG